MCCTAYVFHQQQNIFKQKEEKKKGDYLLLATDLLGSTPGSIDEYTSIDSYVRRCSPETEIRCQ
jgi:hypothetical protein